MIIFLDTESDPITKEPLTIQIMKDDGSFMVLKPFNKKDYLKLFQIWNDCKAIITWNGPYDLGVLSIAYHQNSYEWCNIKDRSGWKLNLFDNHYIVRRIAPQRNIIKPFNKAKKTKSVPVIDLQKLWTILIDEDTKSLKGNIEKYLNRKSIHWSKENAMKPDYLKQDVECLKDLWNLFLDKIKNIDRLKDYDYYDWGFIKTPATFTKLEYEHEYPELKEWQKHNDKQIEKFGLKDALEIAYHGGITIAYHRGELQNKSWLDISGAYANSIIELNTDGLLKFDIEKCSNRLENYSNKLYYCSMDFVLFNHNKSLKIFRLENPSETWVWGNDIIAIKNLYPKLKFKILKAYKFVPKIKTSSLVKRWLDGKNNEKKKNGKTTLYNFYKFLSNCSYGIKAQRNPYRTVHTNMAIAGMITSRVHLILTSIYAQLRKDNRTVYYSDTDSILTDPITTSILMRLNACIRPYILEYEGDYKYTKILSLKRYVSVDSPTGKNKVKLHGRGRYRISENELLDYAIHKRLKNRTLLMDQLGANTQITMTYMLNKVEGIKFPHPFMFSIDVPSDKMLSEFFDEWYCHIDTKTTFQNGDADQSFRRKYHIFKTIQDAIIFYDSYKYHGEEFNIHYRKWDEEIKEDIKAIGP